MIKTITSLTLLFFYSFTYAQNTQNDNEIIVEGVSKTKVKPDIAIFTLSIEKIDTVEKKVIEKVNKEVDEVIKSLYKIGFTSSSIKVSDYNVSSNQDREERTKTYRANNVLKLKFQLDPKLIDRIYKEVQVTGHEDLDISFETKLSDSLEKATRIKLVEQAIINAKSNASNISKALSLKLTGIKQVSKNQDIFLRYASPQVEDLKKASLPQLKYDRMILPTSFEKFDVEEVELEERITIIYRISN